MSIPSNYLITSNVRFIVLDPDLPSAQALGAKPSCSQTVRYPSSSLSTSSIPFSKVSLCSFVSKMPTFNIVDFSAWGGLVNNNVIIQGVSVQIAPGNYSASSLSTTLQAMIDTILGAGTSSVVYNPTTLKFDFSGTNPYTFEISSGGPNIELGLNSGIVYSIPFSSDYSPDLAGPSNILFYIQELSGSTSLVYDNGGYIFEFPLTSTTPAFSQLSPYVNSPKTQAFVPTTQAQISNLTVSLFYTHNGRVYPYFVEGTKTGKPVGGYEMVLAFE